VHVYGGTDPVTGKARRIRVACPDGATAAATLGRLLAEVDEERFPNRDATLGHALDKYLDVADLEVSTREAHEGYVRRIIKPVLGQVKIRKLGADSLHLLHSLYAALKRCSRLCSRLPRTEHHAEGAHQCDQRCGPLRDHRTNRPHECDGRCRRGQLGTKDVDLDDLAALMPGRRRRSRASLPPDGVWSPDPEGCGSRAVTAAASRRVVPPSSRMPQVMQCGSRLGGGLLVSPFWRKGTRLRIDASVPIRSSPRNTWPT
jgi:hypothetical protein